MNYEKKKQITENLAAFVLGGIITIFFCGCHATIDFDLRTGPKADAKQIDSRTNLERFDAYRNAK
jgi:hypothetical protein